MTFLYFCYGSNMLAKRMHINCPSARRKCIALLKNFKFTYDEYAETWKGATANILESPGDFLWGVVWEISKEEEEILDRQEVGYKPIEVSVEDENGLQLLCKSYQKRISNDMDLPSAIYKAVVMNGAKEHNLPLDYIQHLDTFKDNGCRETAGMPINFEL